MAMTKGITCFSMFLLTLGAYEVNSFCNETLSSVVQVDETETNAVIQDIRVYPGEQWNFTIRGINSNLQGALAERVLRGYFDLFQNDTQMVFSVQKAINKEYLFRVFLTDVEIVVVEMECRTNTTIVPTTTRVIVNPVNEESPVFQNSPYNVAVPENTQVNDVVFTFLNVTDADIPQTTTFYYQLINSGNSEIDASNFFYISSATSNQVRLGPTLIDFDSNKNTNNTLSYTTTVAVQDSNDNTARTGTTYITFQITDVDDLPPKFTLPGCDVNCAPVYTAKVKDTFPSPLDISPQPIGARDQDTLNYRILFSIKNDTEGMYQAFRIDSLTGAVTQTAESPSGVLVIVATEDSSMRHSAIATILIQREGDSNRTNGPPLVQRSTDDTSSANTQTIGIIVGVFVLVIIAILVGAFVFFRKRLWKKTVDPVGEPKQSCRISSEGELTPDDQSRSQSKLDLLAAQFYPTPATKNSVLPPLKHDMSIGTDDSHLRKKRPRKRKKKEPEIYDGTRTYDMEADPEFFSSKDKTKIKRSARSIKENKMDSRYWITIHDGYQDY